MNIRDFLLFAAPLLMTAPPLHASIPTSVKAGSQPSAELAGAERALEDFHQALRGGDKTAALAMLADDALIYESGHAETKPEYAAHHLDADIAFAKAVPGKTVRRRGESASSLVWFTTEGRTTGTYKGKAVDRRTTETALLRSDAGKWVIVHLHWSSAASK